MSSVLEFAGRYWMAVASHLWQTTVLILLLSGLAAAMRRAPARVLNALWWVALAKLVVPVSVLAPAIKRVLTPLLSRLEATQANIETVTVWLHRAAPVLDPTASVAERRAGAGVEWIALGLAVVWVLGASWFVVRWLRSRDWSVVRTAVQASALEPPEREKLAAALEGTRVPEKAILVTPERLAPSVVGLVRRRMLLSRDVLRGLDARELRAILLHEDAHRRRFEPLQMLVQRAAVVVFYFFPLLWPVLRRLRETSEMACDEAAVRQGVRPDRYAEALARTIDIGLGSLGLAVGLAKGTPTLTRSRFERLRNEGRFKLRRWHWACLGVAILAAVMTAVLSAVPTVAGETGGTSVSVTSEVKADTSGQQVIDVTVEGDDAAGGDTTYTVTVVHSEPPEYPEDARDKGIEGRVALKVTIDTDGTVSDVTVLQDVDGCPSLTEAAVNAVDKWTFEIKGANAGEDQFEVVIPIEFKLDGKDAKEIQVNVPDATVAPDESAATGESEVPAEPEPPQPPEEPDNE